MPTALLYTMGAFALILLLARLKVPLAAAILAGATVLSFCFRPSAGQVASLLFRGLIDPGTISLGVIVAMLLTLSQAMRSAGQLERMVSLASAILRRPAVAMAALPMLIGLIPMPGGAIFSASMVESAAGKAEVGGVRLSAINYWFRHVWEYWWPLYPAVLVATQQSGLNFGTFAALMCLLTVFMLLSGLWVFRGTHADLRVARPRASGDVRRQMFWATSSIWVIFIAWAATDQAMGAMVQAEKAPPAVVASMPASAAAPSQPAPGPQTQPAEQAPSLPASQAAGQAASKGKAGLMSTLRKFLPVCLGLLVSLAWTARMNRLGLSHFRKILCSKTVYEMAILGMAVMIFQYSLVNVKAANAIAGELRAFNVPIFLVLAILPLIAGLVTGLGVGFVGASFPIVLPLIATMQGSPLPYIMLAYACGHMGMMFSPVHLCQVVSNRYFKVGFAPVCRLILIPAVITLTLAGAYFVALRMILK